MPADPRRARAPGGRARALRRAGRPRRPARPPCGSSAAPTQLADVVRALDAEGIGDRAPPAARAVARRRLPGQDRPQARRRRGEAAETGERGGRCRLEHAARARSASWRAARSPQTLRQPALIVPPILFPLFLLAVNVGGLDAATKLPGFPTDSYLNFAIAIPFMQGALFAAINAGLDLARDVETGFLKRLALTPMQRAALLLGKLAGVMTVAALSSLIYLGGRLRRRGCTSRPASAASLVLIVLAFLIALAFASLGALVGLRAGSGEAVQGLFPLFFVFLFLSSMALPRTLIEQDWFRTIATWNPVSYLLEGIRSRRHHGLGRRRRWGAASAIAVVLCAVGILGASRRAADAAGAHMRRFRPTSRRGRRLAPDPQLHAQPGLPAAVDHLPAVLLHRVRGRALERRQRPGLRLPVRLHGVPVRLRAAAVGGVRRRLHRLRRSPPTSSAASPAGCCSAAPNRLGDPRRLRCSPALVRARDRRRADVRRRAGRRDAGRRRRRRPLRAVRARAARQPDRRRCSRPASRCGCARSRPAR